MDVKIFTLITLVVSSVAGDDPFDAADLVVDQSFTMKKNLEITGLTQEEKDNMLHIHNAYRSLVRPYGADMIELTWDDDIAAFAQEWADQCTATHRTNRDLGDWVNMGENLYWWYSGKYSEYKAVKYWWDEVQYYDLSSHSCQSSEVCGHYVTMAWAKTEKIGCGVARCSRLLDLPDYGRGAYYFVCNYSGRFITANKPYTATDLPCTACHNTDYPVCRNNLCVTQTMVDDNTGYDGSTEITGLTRSISRNTGGGGTAATTLITPTADTAATTDNPTTSPTIITTPTTTPTTTTTNIPTTTTTTATTTPTTITTTPAATTTNTPTTTTTNIPTTTTTTTTTTATTTPTTITTTSAATTTSTPTTTTTTTTPTTTSTTPTTTTVTTTIQTTSTTTSTETTTSPFVSTSSVIPPASTGNPELTTPKGNNSGECKIISLF